MKNKSKMKNAISLIVLVVTILILGILATVVVISLSNGGIIGQAQDAVDKNNESVNKEKSLFEKIEELLNGGSGNNGLQMVDLIGTVVNKNTEVMDEYGNKVVVPEGFKIVAHDNDTVKYTYSDSANNIPTVQDGIVIEDATGGENNGTRFVWVPVGDIKNKDNTTTTISLGDTTNAKNVIEEFSQELIGLQENTPVQKTVFESSSVKFKKIDSVLQDTMADLTNAQGACRALCDRNKWRLETLITIKSERALDTFISTTNKNGGYYISQNQMGELSTTNYQPDSVSLAQEMYGEVKNSDDSLVYASDLINEYALKAVNEFCSAYLNCSNISDIKGFTTRGYVSSKGEGVSTDFNQVTSQRILDEEQSGIAFKKMATALQQQVAELTAAQERCKAQCDRNSVLLSDYESYLNSVLSNFGLSVNIEEASKLDDSMKFERITSLQQQIAELTAAQGECKAMCDQTEGEILKLESTTEALNGIGFRCILYVQ